MTRIRALLLATAATLAVALSAASPAAAAPADKPAVLSSWTQTSASSFNAWNSARQNQGAWAAYGFNWSTDYCSNSPDNPIGFDFTLACHRHDFGYRNHKDLGIFAANKSRLDSAFYEDLKRKCATYNVIVRPACTSLAWTYYQAVKQFGSVIVTSADLNKANRIKQDAIRSNGGLG